MPIAPRRRLPTGTCAVFLAFAFVISDPSGARPDDRVLFEDAFSGKLASGWSWVREDANAWRLAAPGPGIEIRAQPGNLWGATNDAKNLLVRELPESGEGSLVAEVTLTSEPTGQYEQAGLAWYLDDKSIVKLVQEVVDGKLHVVMGREENDRARGVALVPLATAHKTLRLRFEIGGGTITGLWRGEGDDAWKKAGSCDLPVVPPGQRARISLQVYNGPADAEHWVRFTGFRILRAGVTAAALAVREQIGVNIHFTGAPEEDLRLLAQAGFGWVRMDFVWDAVESTKGEYRFDAYDALVAGLEARGIRALFILDYSNRLYETDRSVRTPEGRAAFARFAGAAAARYRGKGIRWEIWNEPNLRQFWSPQPAATDYLELARAASAAIRAADPHAKVLGPATSGFPWDFLEELFAGGFLALVDEVSVHPYRKGAPETALADYARLAELIRKHAPADESPPPITSGEWGYSNWHHGEPLAPEVQAAYLARQFLSNIAAGVPLSIWYDWANDGPDPRETEHNFGTVTKDRRPKPAYLAVKTLTSVLGDARFEKRLEAAEGGHVLLFSSPHGEAFLALWTEYLEERAQAVRFSAPALAGAVRAFDLTGNERRLEAAGGVIEVSLRTAPIYLVLPAAVAREELRILEAAP